jgi:hypothetical protein
LLHELPGLGDDLLKIAEPAVHGVLEDELGVVGIDPLACHAKVFIHIAADGPLDLDGALIERRGLHPAEFIRPALRELDGGAEDDIELAAIGGDAEGREDGDGGAVGAVVALAFDLLLHGGDDLGDAPGLDEAAGDALAGQLDEGVVAVGVGEDFFLGGGVGDGAVDDAAHELGGSGGLVFLLGIDVPKLDHVAVFLEEEVVAAVGIGLGDDGPEGGAFLALGFLDEVFVVAFEGDALAEFLDGNHLAAGDPRGALEIVGGGGEDDVVEGLEGAPFGAGLEDVGGGDFDGLAFAEFADVCGGASAGGELLGEFDGDFLLEGIEDCADEGLEGGVLGFGGHAEEHVEVVFLDLDAGGGAPEDAHDGEAVGGADVEGEFEFAAKVVGAMGVKHPLEQGLAALLEEGVGGFDGEHLHAGGKGGGDAELGFAVADEVGEANAGVGGSFPGEDFAAVVAGPFLAVGGLAVPIGEAGVVVIGATGGIPGGVGGGGGEFADPVVEVGLVVVHQAATFPRPGMRIMVFPVPEHLTTVSGKFFLNQVRNSFSFQQPGYL